MVGLYTGREDRIRRTILRDRGVKAPRIAQERSNGLDPNKRTSTTETPPSRPLKRVFPPSHSQGQLFLFQWRLCRMLYIRLNCLLTECRMLCLRHEDGRRFPERIFARGAAWRLKRRSTHARCVSCASATSASSSRSLGESVQNTGGLGSNGAENALKPLRAYFALRSSPSGQFKCEVFAKHTA